MDMQRLPRKLPLLTAMGCLSFGLGFSAPTVAVEEGVCGPMDVVFVVDDTGSMGDAITNIQAGIASIAADVVTASGGDYQMGLVTFKDNPATVVDLAPVNGAAVLAGVGVLTASGGLGGPEASDAALDMVVNGTDVASGAGCTGVPFNNAGFRPGADKLAIMLTDNLPGGCDDTFTPGVDDTNAARVASDASAAGISISAIYNANSPSPTVVGIMNHYAVTTGGVFAITPSNGSGTDTVITDLIAACGSSADGCPLSQGYWKNHEEDWPVTELTIGGTVYDQGQLLEILTTPPKRGNSYLILAHQLIATLLNIANGSNPAFINDTVVAADAALVGVNLLGGYIKNSSLNALAGILDDYNNRELTPDCNDPEASGSQ